MNGAVPSSSVSSDSQDSVGASDGFPSLGLGLFREGQASKHFFSSRDTPSRAPSLFQQHGYHSGMPYKARVEPSFVRARKIHAMKGRDRNSTVTPIRETVKLFNETKKAWRSEHIDPILSSFMCGT